MVLDSDQALAVGTVERLCRPAKHFRPSAAILALIHFEGFGVDPDKARQVADTYMKFPAVYVFNSLHLSKVHNRHSRCFSPIGTPRE